MRYLKFLDNVILFCIHSDGEIGRQRPGSRRPDGNACSIGEAVSFPYSCRRARLARRSLGGGGGRALPMIGNLT